MEAVENIEELRRNARRYQQLLDHPAAARHLLTLLQTGHGNRTHLGLVLDQLHIQDLAKAGTLAAARIWQQGGADGKTGTERAAAAVLDARAQVAEAKGGIASATRIADKILADSMAAIDANRLRAAERAGHSYDGPERRGAGRAFDPVKADLADLEMRVVGSNPAFAEGPAGA